MKHLKTRAIILKTENLAETDRYYYLFSPIFGKLKAKARGVRRSSSKLGGHLQLLNLVDFHLVEGKICPVITSAETIANYPSLRHDFAKASLALYLAEIVDKAIPLEHPQPMLFSLLNQALYLLDRDLAPDLISLRYAFTVQLFQQVGLWPSLTNCLRCHRPLPPQTNFVNLHSGEVFCPDCQPDIPGHAQALSCDCLKALRYFSRQKITTAARLCLPVPETRRLDTLISSFVQNILETPINSLRLFKYI